MFSGTAAKYLGIRFIFSHAGGTMPFLIERLHLQARARIVRRACGRGGRRSVIFCMIPSASVDDPREVSSAAVGTQPTAPEPPVSNQGGWYDTAQAANPLAVGALRPLVPVDRIMLGRDLPYRTSEEQVRGLVGCGLHAAAMQRIESGNAEALIPRPKT